MSVGLIEKQVLYDNPLAPIVKFSSSENFDEDDDMTNDQPFIQSTLDHSFKAFSLEDLVKSFDNTINSCFSDHEIIESTKTNLVTASKTWSDLIENLHTSLRHDLKLPEISKNCQIAMNQFHETEFQSIDDDDDDEEEKLDMHSLSQEPFLTAEQVISEIDCILKDMTPDSGCCDDFQPLNFDSQSIPSLHELIDDLNQSIQGLSNILVQELAYRDELEDEKEMKNTFIELLFTIQNKRQHYQTDKHRFATKNGNSIEPGTYLTTRIPFDRHHPLSIEHIQNLNKILHAINEDSNQVPELLTNYILKILCS